MATLNINSTSLAAAVATDKDFNQPYSFQDWRIRNANIPPNEAFSKYDTYVKEWYVKKDISNAVSIDYVKQYYKTFLKSLGFSPRNEEEQQFFDNVNFDDPLSLQSVIVGYARKLKNISVYISTRRNSVTYSKIKANLVGTNTSLERLFYSYILYAFTRKLTPSGIIATSFTITDPDILTSLPFLEVIRNSFTIEIEEIYDTSNYFDRDPSVDINTYTTVASGVPAALYEAGEYSFPEDYLFASVVGAVALESVPTMSTTTPKYFTYTGDGFTTSFSLTDIKSNTASDYQVSVDGVLQTPNTSYTVSTINQIITFSEAPPSNSIIVIVIRY